MTKRMLIDANHPEETRVVILDGNKVEEFDFEAASKRPLKGNIYLAKVTRVEPSLQAAFVEYGGNRQGFLAFAEIHPDYYQIPASDRAALIAEQEAEARRRSEDDIESFDITGPKAESAEEEEDETRRSRYRRGKRPRWRRWCRWTPPPDAETEAEDSDEPSGETGDDHEDVFVNHGGAAVELEAEHDHEEDDQSSKPGGRRRNAGRLSGRQRRRRGQAAEENEGEIEPVSIHDDEGHNQIMDGEILPLADGGTGGRRRTGARKRRRPGAAGLPSQPALGGAQEALQDSGSHQAPPDHPGCRWSRRNAATRARR